MWDRYDISSNAYLYSSTLKPTEVAPGVRIASTASAARLAECGWLERTPFVAPTGTVATGSATLTPDWDGLRSIETRETVPAEPAVFEVSKLTIRRTLRVLDMEDAFDAALAANPQAARDWADATVIRSDDPVVLSALPGIAAATGMTPEQALAVLREASVGV